MQTDELNNLITPSQAARLRRVTPEAVRKLMDRGKLPFITIAGKRFLRTADVLNYQPDKGGRPAGTARAQPAKKARRKVTG